MNFTNIVESLPLLTPTQKNILLWELLLQTSGNVENVISHSEIERILNQKSRHQFLRSDLVETSQKKLNELVVSTGVLRPEIKSSHDLEEFDETQINSISNYGKNYKMWLGKKLAIPESEILSKSVEDIDNQFNLYLQYAIQHIHRYFNNFPVETRESIKSEYFDTIHKSSGRMSAFTLMKFWVALHSREENLIKEQNNQKREWINYENIFNEIKIAKFEIQRVFAITLLYIEREKTQSHQHTEEDVDFIVKKLSEITSNPTINDGKNISSNPIYHLTNTSQKYWKKDTDNNYVFFDTKEEGTSLMKVEHITLRGKTKNYSKHSHEVKCFHISPRVTKDGYSAVDKIIRKNLASFTEILDERGFMIVVEDEKDIPKLISILETELGSDESSWTEKGIVQMKTNGNENTNATYNCFKGNLKVPYKGKLIKEFFKKVEKMLKNNKNIIAKIKKFSLESSPDIQTIEDLLKIEIKDSEVLKELFLDLKQKFKNKEYLITIEIQIFNKNNYMKAEIDKSSPAHHDHYKARQILQSAPYYLPLDVYATRVRKIIENKEILTS